jgi:ribosomal protein S27E
MMLGDDEGPKDWEIQDEEPPEQLRKKWEREESEDFKKVVCPSCEKETSSAHSTCIFCGATLVQENCPIGCFLTWVKRLFKKV